MRKNRFWTPLLSGVLVVAVATGAALLTTRGSVLLGGVSHATPLPSISRATVTTTMLTTAPASPAPQNTKVTLTATVTPATAAGTVQFKDGANPIGLPVIVASGTASGSTSMLTVGSHSLTAVFTPTNPALVSPSTSPEVTFMVTAPVGSTATSTALAASPASPAPQGTQVMLTSTVTPAEAAGLVQFKDGANPLGSPVTVSNGTASMSTSALTTGSHQLTAVFTPTNSTTYTTSTSQVVNFLVTDASGVAVTNTTLATSPASSAAQGNPVMLTATVTPAGAVGNVQFKDGTALIGSPVVLSNGKASVSTSTLAVGSHQLTAVFSSTNPAYGPSASSAVTFVVTAAVVAPATTTTLTVFPDFPIPQGVPVLLRATVVPDGAAGTVQFQDGTTALGAPAPVTAGSATFITTALQQGTHSLTAVFTPTNRVAYGPSTSPVVSLTVTGAVGGALLERTILRVQRLIQDILDGDRNPDDPRPTRLGG